MSIKYIAIVIVFLSVVALVFLKPESEAPRDKFQVVTSFYPLAFLAQEIGGDAVDVYNITPAGAEPHDYELTPGDVARIAESDLLIQNGGVEQWADDLQNNLSGSEVKIVNAGEKLMSRTEIEDGETVADPHVWLSPPLAALMVDVILDAFIAVDPENAARYKENATLLKVELQKLDAEFKAGLASCGLKEFVTSHAAFGYLAAEYGLVQIPITGLSPDAEPSARELADITELVKKRSIEVIFFEELVSPELSETIAKETGARTMMLNPIEGLSPEDLAAGMDYLSEMRENLSNLRVALKCAK